MIIASNIAYENPYGWAREDEGSVTVQCYTLVAATLPLDQIAPPAEEGITWEEVTLSGRKAIHRFLQPGLPGAADSLFFATHNGWLVMYIEPAGAYTNPAVQKIINTLEFAPGG